MIWRSGSRSGRPWPPGKLASDPFLAFPCREGTHCACPGLVEGERFVVGFPSPAVIIGNTWIALGHIELPYHRSPHRSKNATESGKQAATNCKDLRFREGRKELHNQRL